MSTVRPQVSRKTINITVEGGLIQWVGNIPDGIRVVVRDYDVDDATDVDLATDDSGDKYVESIWENEENT